MKPFGLAVKLVDQGTAHDAGTDDADGYRLVRQIEAGMDGTQCLRHVGGIDHCRDVALGRALGNGAHVDARTGEIREESCRDTRRAGHAVANHRHDALLGGQIYALDLSTRQFVCKCVRYHGLCTVGQDYMWVAEKGKYVLVAVSSSLVLNVVLNMLLIPTMGMWGAVIATSIANGANLILIYGCNQLVGCKTDAGVWLTAILPACLLLPPVAIVIVLAVVAIVALKTRWIFNDEEKSQLGAMVAGIRGKLGF